MILFFALVLFLAKSAFAISHTHYSGNMLMGAEVKNGKLEYCGIVQLKPSVALLGYLVFGQRVIDNISPVIYGFDGKCPNQNKALLSLMRSNRLVLNDDPFSEFVYLESMNYTIAFASFMQGDVRACVDVEYIFNCTPDGCVAHIDIANMGNGYFKIPIRQKIRFIKLEDYNRLGNLDPDTVYYVMEEVETSVCELKLEKNLYNEVKLFGKIRLPGDVCESTVQKKEDLESKLTKNPYRLLVRVLEDKASQSNFLKLLEEFYEKKTPSLTVFKISNTNMIYHHCKTMNKANFYLETGDVIHIFGSGPFDHNYWTHRFIAWFYNTSSPALASADLGQQIQKNCGHAVKVSKAAATLSKMPLREHEHSPERSEHFYGNSRSLLSEDYYISQRLNQIYIVYHELPC